MVLSLGWTSNLRFVSRTLNHLFNVWVNIIFVDLYHVFKQTCVSKDGWLSIKKILSKIQTFLEKKILYGNFQKYMELTNGII